MVLFLERSNNAAKILERKQFDWVNVSFLASYLANLNLVRQQNIERLAGSQISNDSEVDTNGKIHS